MNDKQIFAFYFSFQVDMKVVEEQKKRCDFAPFFDTNPEVDFTGRIPVRVSMWEEALESYLKVKANPADPLFWARWDLGEVSFAYNATASPEWFTVIDEDSVRRVHYHYDPDGPCVKFEHSVTGGIGQSQQFQSSAVDACVLVDEGNGTFAMHVAVSKRERERDGKGSHQSFSQSSTWV